MRLNNGCLIAAVILGMSLLAFLVIVVRGEQEHVWDAVAMTFLEQECRTGSLPEDSEEFMRKALSDESQRAKDRWGIFGAKAQIVSMPNGESLRVTGTYLWPFTIEEPLDRGMVRCRDL